MNLQAVSQLPESVLKWKPYSAYKDSSIEWVGTIPKHWTVVRICEEADLLNGYPFESGLFHLSDGIPLVRIRDLESEITEVMYSGPIIPEALIKTGDIIIGMDGDFNVARWRGGQALLNQRLCCLKPKSTINDTFLFCVLRFPLQVINDLTYSTTVKHLSSIDVLKSRFARPPLNEQIAIAKFLDRETAKIDALVAKKERLIALLQEKRAALITRAVTKGLDPNVSMKDSGVEWLGEIPAHWDAAKMWRISTAFSGGTPNKDEAGYWGGDIPWVSPKDMKRRFIEYSEDLITEDAVNDTRIKLIEPPVVLIVVRGMILAHSFPVAVTTIPVTINQDMKALRFRHHVAPVFMAWLLDGIGKGVVAHVVEEAAHGTRAIRMDQWRLVTVPIPPQAEQRAITLFLDQETTKIDALSAKILEGVDKLKEYRTALISAAVTGKVDVREQM